MKQLFWVATNIYGRIFGQAFLAPLHHAIVTFSLHALGYGNMYRDTWTGEEWFVKKILAPKNPKVIFDVGANVGAYSKMLLAYTDATIFAFEPNPSSFRELSKLDNRVHKINSAVSNTVGTQTLYFKFDFDGKASLDSRVRGGNSVDVSTTTLADFVKENNITTVDYIKIDTEGFEREVIEGLRDLKPMFIQFEFNINHLQRDCTLNEITKLLSGYTFYRLLPAGWVQINPESYIDNIFIFSNVIAVRQ
jgi:FkbM family methyltransferase